MHGLTLLARAAAAAVVPFSMYRLSPRQFPAHVFDVVRCLRERGFAFAPEFGKEFAHTYIKSMGADIAQRKKERIAGEVEQYAMPQTGTSPWPTTLRRKWHTLVAKLAEHVGVDPEQLQLLIGVKPEEVRGAKPQLHVQDEKLLIAGRQRGEQAPHFGEWQGTASVRLPGGSANPPRVLPLLTCCFAPLALVLAVCVSAL